MSTHDGTGLFEGPHWASPRASQLTPSLDDPPHVAAYKAALWAPDPATISRAIQLAVEFKVAEAQRRAPAIQEPFLSAIADAMAWGLNGCHGYDASKAIRSFAILSMHPQIMEAITSATVGPVVVPVRQATGGSENPGGGCMSCSRQVSDARAEDGL